MLLLVAGLALATSGCGGAESKDTIQIGLLMPCEGWWGGSRERNLAGAELPFLQRGASLAGATPLQGVAGASVAGKPLELHFGCGDGTAEKAISEARRLVEVVGVDALIAADQDLAIREYAHMQPAVTFVAASILPLQSVTLHDPAPNLFRFTPDEAQFMAGLGDYAYNDLGWRRVVTVADEYGHQYTRVAGFVAEFCSLGGVVVKQIWVPPDTQDFSPYIAEVPPAGFDGLLLTGWDPAVLAFADGLPRLRGNLAHSIIGSLSMSTATLAEALGDRLVGVTWGFPDQDGSFDPPELKYASDYDDAFPSLAGSGLILDTVVYYSAMEALLQALERVGGDLSNEHKRLHDALTKLDVTLPYGRVKLDARRQAIGPNVLLQWRKGPDGTLEIVTLRTVGNVEQTLGGYFDPEGPPLGKDTITCKRGNPPEWTGPD